MYEKQILICAGTGCISSGSKHVQEALSEELQKHDLQDKVRIILSGCHGFFEKGQFYRLPGGRLFCEVKAEDVPELVEEHLVKGNVVERLLYKDPVSEKRVFSHKEYTFYSKQKRQILRNCGVIDPENIDEYIIRGGYSGMKKLYIWIPWRSLIQ